MDNISAKELRAGPWFSEPALWMSWQHLGEMTALTHTELFCLEAHRFQELMLQELPDAAICWRYAKAFATHAKQCGIGLTDVYIDRVALEQLVSSARWDDSSMRFVGVQSTSIP